MKPQTNCRTCRFWDPMWKFKKSQQYDADAEMLQISNPRMTESMRDQSKNGLCRYNAPSAGSSTSMWAETQFSDWCGQHELLAALRAAAEEAEASETNREHERKSVLENATLWANETWSECSVVDISLGGAQISTEDRLEVGTMATLRFADYGDFTGQIVRSWKGFYGMKFDGDPRTISGTLTVMAANQ